ncbi:MAG: integrase domain-containing protein [Deltaproteobacteria bacterium]|nr:integrase domain-containing protein [Deltaproteobacteria bacterium]
MSHTDSLITGARTAIKHTGGSYKTRYNHIREAERFVTELRSIGYGVQKWTNLTNKHVAAVVHNWQDRKLAVATLKEYLSGVRVVAKFFGNTKISGTNSDFGIEKRIYVTNTDKALHQTAFDKAIETLKAGNNLSHRVAAQLQLQRALGLRNEESMKFSPRSVLSDGCVLVSAGTTGGRERMLSEISDQGRAAIQYAQSVMKKGDRNTMPKSMTERQWKNYFYRTARQVGISKDKSGASSEGNRYYYAQQRYQTIAGFAPPCQFSKKEDFQANAEQIAGGGWTKLDQDARQILKAELGHVPDRNSVIGQYIGAAR